MAQHGAALLFELIAKDGASPAFLRVAGAADKAAASTAAAQKKSASSMAAMSAAGAKLTKAFTLPLAAVAAVGVKSAMDLQKSMTLLKTAAGESDANVRVIASGIKKVSSETATSLHDLSEGIYVIGKAAKSRGWTGAEQLNILRAAAQGAKAEMVPLGVATDALTTIMTDYHAKASDAVKVENQLVKASGLAKTNFGLFSESLSNVSPIAAALGVSFDQVGGAIATMTQHGVTAQRATDNLRNLLFNLSGQNNVASQAMQQLGIDTVDLSKNLGKRGLTGTLAIVDAAMKAHTKNGMVVTDVHKAAALATKSLDTMLDNMGGKLKSSSSGLLKGSVSIKDYTKYAKTLGGQQGVMALQFRNLYLNSLGFSNQLKTGKGTLSTSVQQYQKALGGMTSATVAMQIGGKYAGDFAKNVAAISGAAEHAGKNVHGWEQTQQTLAYKLKDASNKAALFAEAAGEKLLPLLGKLADMGSKAFQWFDGLSSGEKKLLGFSAVALAAIGPVLAIGSRVGTAIAGLSRFAGAAETTSSRVGVAMQRMTTALAGVGIAYAGTQQGGKAGLLTTIFGGAMSGAAVGSFFGPWGTAIGGLTGALGGLTAALLTNRDTGKRWAKDSIETAQAAAKAYRDSIADMTSALSGWSNRRSQYAKDQIIAQTNQMKDIPGANESASVLQLVNQAGVSVRSMLTTLQGGDPRALGALLDKLAESKNLNPAELKYVNKQLVYMATALDNVDQNNVLAARAAGRNIVANKNLGTSVAKVTAALQGNRIQGTFGQEVMREQFAAITANTTAYGKQGANLEQVNARYNSQIGALKKTLGQFGYNTKSVHDLTVAYGKVPKVVTTALRKQGVTPAEIQAIISKYGEIPQKLLTELLKTGTKPADIQEILNKYALIPKTVPTNIKLTHSGDKTSWITDYISTLQAYASGHPVNVPVTHAPGRVTTLIPNMGKRTGRAAGGVITGPGTGTSDSIPAWLSNGEFVVNAKQTRRNLGLLRAINDGAPGFASGGVVNGVKYASDLAYRNARARAARADQSSLLSRVDTAIGNVGSVYTPKFSVTDVGIGRIRAQIKAAVGALNSAIRDGLAGKYVGALRSRIAGLTKLANQQLASLKLKIRTSDLNAIRKALSGSADDIRAAISQAAADMKAAGFSAARIRALTGTGGRLASAQTQLASMRDYRSGVRGTLAGQFDSTTYGSVQDLLAGFTSATAGNNTYARQVNKLRGEAKGNRALLAYINDLAAKGQTTTLATLAGATRGQLQQVGKAVAGYNGSLNAGADAATTAEFGKSVAAQQKNLDRLEKDVEKLMRGVHTLAKAMGAHAVRQSANTQKALEQAVDQLSAASRAGMRA